MDLSSFMEKLIDLESELSACRVCGLIGWAICLIVILYSVIMWTQGFIVLETLLSCSMILLSVDAITTVWKKVKLKNE